jgi:hypothetical protein
LKKFASKKSGRMEARRLFVREPRITQTDCGIGAKSSPASRDHRMTAHFLLRASADHAQSARGVRGRAFATSELPLSHVSTTAAGESRRPLAGKAQLVLDLARSAAVQQGRKMKPRGRPFPKGTSGNPKGRPKEYEEVKAAAREYTVESIERLAYWMRSNDSRASVLAADKLLDRGWASPARI